MDKPKEPKKTKESNKPEEPSTWCTLATTHEGPALKLSTMRIVAKQPDGRTVEAPLELRPCIVGTRSDCDLVVDE